MASVHDSIPHIIRTANDPRQTGLYNATLSHIEQVNSKIRLLRLSLSKDGVGNPVLGGTNSRYPITFLCYRQSAPFKGAGFHDSLSISLHTYISPKCSLTQRQ